MCFPGRKVGTRSRRAGTPGASKWMLVIIQFNAVDLIGFSRGGCARARLRLSAAAAAVPALESEGAAIIIIITSKGYGRTPGKWEAIVGSARGWWLRDENFRLRSDT